MTDAPNTVEPLDDKAVSVHQTQSTMGWVLHPVLPPVATTVVQPVKKRIDSLQSMRLLAALAVFQNHLWTNYLGLEFVHPGTDFFIVLVGMVAALSDAGKIVHGNWKNYILRRYLRLYVTFIPIFILYILAGRDEMTPVYLIKSFFFIPSPGRMPLVGPTWMLAMFLAFYWLFALAVLFRREAALVPIFTVWGMSCLVVAVFDLHFPVFDKGLQIFFSLRNLEFIAGYGAGWLVRNRYISGNWGRKLLGAGLLVLLGSAVFLNSGEHGIGVRVLLYGTAMTLIASGLASQERDRVDNTVVRVMTHRWLVWLGGASYVIYLTHNMLLRIWDTVLPLTVWQAPLVTLFGLVVAALGYQLWEKPVLAFVSSKLLPKAQIDKIQTALPGHTTPI